VSVTVAVIITKMKLNVSNSSSNALGQEMCVLGTQRYEYFTKWLVSTVITCFKVLLF